MAGSWGGRRAEQIREAATDRFVFALDTSAMNDPSTPAFERFIGIDYAGAATPEKGLPGLRVFEAGVDTGPVEIRPKAGARDHWSRRVLAGWLEQTLANGPPALVGIDHGFSFPLAWFTHHGVERNWPGFLDDFCRHWPSDAAGVTVAAVRRGEVGHGQRRAGHARWRRLTEQRAGPAKSVFHFDVPGAVAHSTHAGLPWLRYLRARLGNRVHFWPFDGWSCAGTHSVVAEIYPSLWDSAGVPGGLTPDQRDAFLAASALQQGGQRGDLPRWFEPGLDPREEAIASVEGWILGVR